MCAKNGTLVLGNSSQGSYLLTISVAPKGLRGAEEMVQLVSVIRIYLEGMGERLGWHTNIRTLAYT